MTNTQTQEADRTGTAETDEADEFTSVTIHFDHLVRDRTPGDTTVIRTSFQTETAVAAFRRQVDYFNEQTPYDSEIIDWRDARVIQSIDAAEAEGAASIIVYEPVGRGGDCNVIVDMELYRKALADAPTILEAIKALLGAGLEAREVARKEAAAGAFEKYEMGKRFAALTYTSADLAQG